MDFPALQFPPEMLLAIAAGEPDFDVAARFGYPASEFTTLRELPSYKAALQKAQEVVDVHGEDAEVVEHAILLTMAGGISRDLYEVYHRGNTPLDMKVRIANSLYQREGQLRDRLRPKAAQPASSGPGFTINITIPSVGERPAEKLVLDAGGTEA